VHNTVREAIPLIDADAGGFSIPRFILKVL
jgi:hypothetical protein